MGIRPRIYLLCGVNDLKLDIDGYSVNDPRFEVFNKDDDIWDFMNEKIDTSDLPTSSPRHGYLRSNHYIRDRHILKDKKYNDLLELDTEYGDPNVLAVVIDKSEYADNWTYGLASAFPVLQESKAIVLEKYSLDQDCSLQAWILKDIMTNKYNFSEMRDLVK